MAEIRANTRENGTKQERPATAKVAETITVHASDCVVLIVGGDGINITIYNDHEPKPRRPLGRGERP
jgi:hypothetical protein